MFSLLLIGGAIFFVLPSPIDPVAWNPPKNKGFIEPFESNNQLNKLQMLITKECIGCEDIAVNASGQFIYGGEIDGDIMSFNMNNQEGTIIANTKGRPLGLHFDANGNLIIADAIIGLLSLDIKTGVITLLTNSCNGKKLNFVDDLDIDTSGIIYFSDASSKFGYSQSIEDLMERNPHGSIYAFNPTTNSTTLLLDKLYFANGVAVSTDQHFLMFNETGNYSVSKYWLRGPKKGTREFIHQNLPGYPDGISTGSDQIFWLTLVSPRLQSVEDMMPSPNLRRLAMKLPDGLKPAPVHYSCVIGIDSDGVVKYNFQSPDPKYVEITSVQEYGNRIYFGSLTDTGIAYLDI